MNRQADERVEIEITPEMEIEGAYIIQAHTRYGIGLARDVAREVFLVMSDKKSKSHD